MQIIETQSKFDETKKTIRINSIDEIESILQMIRPQSRISYKDTLTNDLKEFGKSVVDRFAIGYAANVEIILYERR